MCYGMASHIVFMFTFESMVCGYREYRLIWGVPAVGEELNYHCELGNSHDPYAVAVKKVRSRRLVACANNRSTSKTFWRVKLWRIVAKFANVFCCQSFPLYSIGNLLLYGMIESSVNTLCHSISLWYSRQLRR